METSFAERCCCSRVTSLMFSSNRGSCTVSRTRTRGRTKTRRRNAPSVFRYWRRGRTSGNGSPLGVCRSQFGVCNYTLVGVSVSVRTDLGRQVWRFFFFLTNVSRDIFLSLKTQRYSNQQKTPECPKITGLMKPHFWHWLSFFTKDFSALCWHKTEKCFIFQGNLWGFFACFKVNFFVKLLVIVKFYLFAVYC